MENLSDTMKENILLGYPDENSLADAIYQSVFDEDLIHFEKGIDTMLGTKGINLSGGQLQRVAAARMLIRGAELLVLDDISSALDINTESCLWERLDDLRRRKGSTLLVVTQKKFAWKYADQIIVFDNGRITMQGTPNELKYDNMDEILAFRDESLGDSCPDSILKD
jgi:ATP-binding cassette subfamily B protein